MRIRLSIRLAALAALAVAALAATAALVTGDASAKGVLVSFQTPPAHSRGLSPPGWSRCDSTCMALPAAQVAATKP